MKKCQAREKATLSVFTMLIVNYYFQARGQ